MKAWFIALGLACVATLPCIAQKSPAQAKELADGLYARQLFDLAIREYEALVKEHPDFPALDVVYYRLGEAYGKTGNPAKAQETYRVLLTKFPGSSFAARSSLRRAEELMETKEYAKALALLAPVTKAQADASMAAAAFFYSGRCHLALEQKPQAKAAFQTVTTTYQETPYASLASLEAARLIQNQMPAGQEMDAATEAELIRLFQLALRQPASRDIGAEAQFQLSNVLYRQGKFAEAAREYETLAHAWPESARVVEARLPSAWCHFNTGSARAALDVLEGMDQKQRMQSPGEWLYLKANCLRQLHDYDGAVRAYAQLIQSAATSEFTPSARYERTLILYDQKHFDEVVVAAKELEADPKLKENALWLQAQANTELKRGVEAAAVYARIAREFPASERARDALLAAAQGHETAEQYAPAADLYGEFAKRYPGDPLAPRAWYSIGLSQLKNGNLDEAVKAWKTLAEKFPADPLSDDGLFQGAITLFKQNEKAQAEEVLAFLLEKIPDTEHKHNARFYRAVLLDEQKENLVAAGQAWSEFVESNPPEEIRRQGLHRLGLNLYRQGKLDEAASALAAAADTPEVGKINPALLLWLCQHQEQHKHYASAIRVAGQLTGEGTADRERQIAWWVMGRSEDALGRSGLAADAFTQCVDIKLNTVENTEAALRLGALMRDASRFDEARRALAIAGTSASALGQTREQARSYMLLGDVAGREKDWNNAARYFMSVAVLFDDKEVTPEALFRAAEAFGEQGRFQERDRNLLELKNRYPDSPFASKKLD